MNELIKIEDNDIDGQAVQTVNARDLHEYLQNGKQFTDWIKNRIKKYGFIENQDFVRLHQKVKANNATMTEYHLSIDMAKELSMLEASLKGKEARQYFIAMENLAKGNIQTKPLTQRELLQQQLEALDKIEALEGRIEQDKPKVDFYEKVARMDGDLSVAEAAKLIGTGQKTLMAFMREKEWVNRKNEPYQEKISRGLLDVKLNSYKHPENGIQEIFTPRVKPKGLIELRKLWETRFEIDSSPES